MSPELYLQLRRRIEEKYQHEQYLRDLEALETVWALANPDTPSPYRVETWVEAQHQGFKTVYRGVEVTCETLEDLSMLAAHLACADEQADRDAEVATSEALRGGSQENAAMEKEESAPARRYRQGPVDIKCPQCGSDVYRKGMSRSGKTRYRCRGLKIHTFVEDATANCGCGRPGHHKGVCAFRRGKPTLADAVLKALEDGPGTPHELADRTGIDSKAVSAVFSVLGRDGKVETVGTSMRKGQKAFIRALVQTPQDGDEQESDDPEGSIESEEAVIPEPVARSLDAPTGPDVPQVPIPAPVTPAIQRYKEIKAYRQRARGIAVEPPQSPERVTEPARGESAPESSAVHAAKPPRARPELEKASCGICVWRELPPERKGEKPKRTLAAQPNCPKHGSLMEESIHTAKQGQSLGN